MAKRHPTLTLLLLLPALWFGGGALAASPKALVESAKFQIASGDDAHYALDSLLASLAAANDEDVIHKLLSGVEELGDADGSSPQSVKQYLRAKAPPVLRQVFAKPIPWNRRSEALMLHRTLEASDDDLRQAIALALADDSPQKEFMKSRGELLQRWLDQRTPERRAELSATPVENAESRDARTAAGAQGIGVNVDALMNAARRGSVEKVRTLLDAGLDVNTKSSAWTSPLAAAATGNCIQPGADLAGNLAVMDLLLERGANPDAFDDRNNSILMSASQQCPAPIIRRLLDGGAQVNPINMQDFTPLEMALVLGKIDVAELLVERGARRDHKHLNRVFAESPSDPRIRAVLDKAAKKGK